MTDRAFTAEDYEHYANWVEASCMDRDNRHGRLVCKDADDDPCGYCQCAIRLSAAATTLRRVAQMEQDIAVLRQLVHDYGVQRDEWHRRFDAAEQTLARVQQWAEMPAVGTDTSGRFADMRRREMFCKDEVRALLRGEAP